MKQKIFTLLFAVAVSMGTMFASVSINGIFFNLDETELTAEVEGGGGRSVVIPESIIYGGMTYSVTRIRERAYMENTLLTSLTIPKSVTNIGYYAFTGCTSLTSVHISDIAAWCNISFEGRYANPLEFAHNLYLNGELVKNLVIPNGVTSIGAEAFYGCSSLTSVTIPNSVTSIGDYAFGACYSVKEIHFTGTLEEWITKSWEPSQILNGDGYNYCYYALYIGDELQTSITIPNGITSIGDRAFYSCGSLTSVTIPNSVTSIGDRAFSYCANLTSVAIGESVTSIETNAFYGCYGIASVIWNAKNCSAYNFGYQVETFAFGDSVEVIPANLCKGMTRLTSITIPNSVTSIEDEAFFNCYGLTSVILNSDAIVNQEIIVNIFGSGVTEYIIGDSVTSIGIGAFAYCSGLTSITIPNSVTSIGNSAFYNCTGLTSVTIPNSVTSIGIGAFAYCSGLTSVTIPNSVTSIGDYAFCDCTGLTSVTIGNSVTSIGQYAFSNCTGLTSVTCYATTPPVLGDNVFNNVNCAQIPLYVPDESAAQYRVTDQWKNFDVRPLNPFSCIVNASASHGIVEGAGEYEGYSNITLKVIPENGYIFKQWSDGNTDNPRTMIIRQDTMLTAICEEYQKPINTDLPYNEPFTSSIGRFSISDVNTDGLSYVWTWASANYGMKASAYVSKTSHATESWLISPPISLMNASNIVLSFQHAVNKGTPTNLSVKISTDLGTTWRDLSISNWPAGTDWNFVSASESLDAYANNTVQIAFVYVSTTSDCPTWEIKNFSITGTIGVDPGEPMPITVDANETTAAVTWLEVPNTVTYELIIYDSNWNVICVIVFDSEGHVLNVTNYAPARDKLSQQEQTGGFAYTIAGLNSGTEYNYMLVAKDNTDKMVTSYSGSFKTTGSATALEEVDDHLLQSNPTQCTKVIRNGQIYILRGDKTYTLQGQEVK